MKDRNKKEIEKSKPNLDVIYLINFCLKALYEDKDHKFTDSLASKKAKKGIWPETSCLLTYEELIGTLLKARDEIKILKKIKKYGKGTHIEEIKQKCNLI